MKKPKLRELGEAVRAIVKGPYTTRFPFVVTEPIETYRGKVEFDEATCIGCGACAQVCPPQAIRLDDDREKGVRRLTILYDVCIFCGQCTIHCTTETGIKHTRDYDLAEFDRIQTQASLEKELVFCEGCGEVIGTRDQLVWLAKKMGEVAYANPTIFLASARELGLIEDEMVPPADMPPYRSQHMRLLCPLCRRKAHLREEWGY
jgi:hydrogenase-4 component H